MCSYPARAQVRNSELDEPNEQPNTAVDWDDDWGPSAAHNFSSLSIGGATPSGQFTQTVDPVAERYAAPNNVVLLFPRCGREIWTNEALLSMSPYLAALLSSSFKEGNPVYHVESATGNDPDELGFEDSDIELDIALPNSPSSSSSVPCGAHKSITVTETSYSTYLAVVCWLFTGKIAFGPLASCFSSSNRTEAAKQRKERLLYSFSSTPSLVPVSPKSVYRLCHLLELSALSHLALANFTSQLTVNNVAHELFTDTACCYDELGDAALKVFLEHKKEVVKSEAFKAVKTRAEAGELSTQEGTMWAKLASRLLEQE
ncbi:hypothetical protein JCM8097_000699 [Rhodosporidiobolus ruineniae]